MTPKFALALTTALFGAATTMAAAQIVVSAPTAITADDEVKTISGKINSVDTSNKSFVINADGKTITLTVDDATRYTLDGQPSTMEATLKSGHTAVVTHKGKMASSVSATSAAPPEG